MSKKSKEHRKRVASRNQKLINKGKGKTIDADKIINSGMATPIEALSIAKHMSSKGKNPVKVFNRRTQ